ncbi:hypothetical protein E5288_WYG020011 [Bos mutus]|uniref:Uncharacterized protein n=1 Tax=Bos mutus TaxID=72004 RepID=A0A6B0RNM3_9CETA|nr:hypothetical protein [Bos mutus]
MSSSPLLTPSRGLQQLHPRLVLRNYLWGAPSTFPAAARERTAKPLREQHRVRNGQLGACDAWCCRH